MAAAAAAAPGQARSKCGCRTSATSRTWRSSNCWSSPATRSRSSNRCSPSSPTRRRWRFRQSRGRDQGTQGQAGRQGQRRGPDRGAGRHGRRSRPAGGSSGGCGDAVRRARRNRPPRRRRRRPAGHRAPPTAALPPHEPGAPVGTPPHASPSVRKFARELGVPLEEVKGTRSQGPHHAGGRPGLHQGCDEGRSQHPGRRGQGGGGRQRRGAGAAALAEGGFRQVRSRSSARTWAASARSAAPTCIATG